MNEFTIKEQKLIEIRTELSNPEDISARRDAIKTVGVPAEYEGDARSTWWYVCGECHGAIDIGEQKCRHCGTVIIWDGLIFAP